MTTALPIDILSIISRLEADPYLRVQTLAEELGIHKSVLNRHIRKAGREDLATRYAQQRSAGTDAKYSKMIFFLDNDPELIVRDAADKAGLHWNGTHVKKRLTQMGREDLLLRFNPTIFKVTKNVEQLCKMLDADPELSVKQAAYNMGMLQEVAARQLRERGFEKYINRKQKRAVKSRNAKAAKLVKRLQADPNASARQLSQEGGIRHTDFLQYLHENGLSDLVQSRQAHSEEFIAKVCQFVVDNPRKSCRSVSKKFGVSASTLKRWCEQKNISADFGHRALSKKDKKAITQLAIARLEAHPELSLSQLAREPGFPVTFSCVRRYLINAGRNDLVIRHRKAFVESHIKDITDDLLEDFKNPWFTVTLASQKYEVAGSTVINKLRAAGRNDLVDRKVHIDYSDFEIGRIYTLGSRLYAATVKCLITVVDGKIKQASAIAAAYKPVDDLTVKNLALAWGLETIQDFDDLVRPYMSDLYPLHQAA